MSLSLEQFLNLTAQRGSWYGGGSAAALTCAVAAALLEKLVSAAAGARSLRSTRTQAARLVQRDAETFARVIKAYYQQDRAAIKRTLKEATEVPLAIAQASAQVLAVARQMKRTIKPRYRSDLTCVEALARASRRAAEAFVSTNLAWLDDPAYTRKVRKQLAAPTRRRSTAAARARA